MSSRTNRPRFAAFSKLLRLPWGSSPELVLENQMRQIHQNLRIHSSVMRIMGNSHRTGCGNSFPALQSLAVHSLTTDHALSTRGRHSITCALLDRDVLLLSHMLV